MFGFVRGPLTAALGARGYEVKAASSPLRRAPAFLADVKARGLRVGTVIDVGVGFGTPWLMDAFPDAYTVLIEPNRGFRPAIDALMATRRGEVHYVAGGPVAGEARLTLNVAAPTSSSMYAYSEATRGEYVKRGWPLEMREVTVPVEPLDSLDQSRWPKPYLLKLDSEGYELEVLKGCVATLRDTAMLISEISVMKRYEASYSFAEFIATIDGHGFELFDIVDMLQFGSVGRLSAIDGVFVPKGAVLTR